MNELSNKTERQRAASHAARINLGERSTNPQHWSEESEAFQHEFIQLSHLLADMDPLKDDPDIILARTQPSANHWRATKYVFAAASLLVIGLALTLLLPQIHNAKKQAVWRYVTQVGEQKEIDLPDGSVINLNTGTEILVQIGDDTRKVILQRGEAHFDVAENPQKPFTVDVGFRSVTVLGTRFNVRRLPDKMQVAVTEGLVSIHKPEESVLNLSPHVSDIDSPDVDGSQHLISAGWVAEFNDADRLSAYQPENMDDLILWRTGTLDFDNIPLVDVVRELNRYSPKKILLEGTEIIDLKIWAVMQTDRIDLALKGLEYAYPVKVTHHFDQIVLTGKNKK